ncbi:hypothetical protein [Flavobacterium litorale]|uniref:Uncharacterized protein n=1 Tax=Flavobacterium litorale TaxID=2856519 RepID=A0ABX8VCD8_9FLAO|nr:hypothetical protein [Flavobacterium litorale]QYJ68485.1 hypothetical protein K1I41_00965 [Flavobacterium litorale]
MTNPVLTLTRQEIITAIHQWKNVSTDATTVVNYFRQGNSFSYSIPKYAQASVNIHIYPAIHHDMLVFLIIPADYDKVAHDLDFQDFTYISYPMWNVGNGTLPDREAVERIKRWNDHYEQWIPQQINTVDGIFRAFRIGRDDFQVKDTEINMALRKDPIDPLAHFIADLIVTNKEETRVFYEDLAEPVPPFSASAALSSFYLLTL